MDTEKIIERDQDVFVTNTTIKPTVSVDELIALLRKRKATGKIEILLNQGGKQQILVTEHTKLSSVDRDAVRKILKME